MAKEAVDRLSFDCTGMDDFMFGLARESETAQVLIFHSYLDDRMQQLIEQQLEHLDTQAAKDRLFGNNGPLGTSSSRTLMAYHLGWLSSERVDRLDAFRKIRNIFAHEAFRTTMTDPRVAAQLARVDYDIDEIMKSSPLSRVTRSKNGSYVLAKLVMLAFHTFGDLMVLPAAKEFGVSRKEILDEPWPKLLKDLEAAFSQALGTAAIFAPKEKHPPRLVK
jgi:hypothetical protein